MDSKRRRLSARATAVAALVVVAAAVSPTVTGRQGDRLVIDAVPPLLSVGTTVRPAVYFRDATGARVNVTASVVWTSSNVAVATVEKGELRAVAAGDARVTATWGDTTATVAVRVIAGPVPERVVEPRAEPERPAPTADARARDRPAGSEGGTASARPGSGSASAGGGAGLSAGPAPPRPERWRDLGSALASAIWADFSLSSAPATTKATQLHLGRSTVYATWLVVGLTLLVGGLARGVASQAWVQGALLAAGGAVLVVIAPGLARLPGGLFDIVAVLTVLTLLLMAQLAFSVRGSSWRDPVARRSLVMVIWFVLGLAAALAWAVWSLMRNPPRVA